MYYMLRNAISLMQVIATTMRKAITKYSCGRHPSPLTIISRRLIAQVVFALENRGIITLFIPLFVEPPIEIK
jgi:hypothetical protein